MRGRSPNQLDRVVAERGDRQFGVVSRDELLAVSSVQTVDRAVAKLRLRPLFAGVYAIGHTAIRREGWWLAALKACGANATLGGRSAGQYWRYDRGPLFPVTVFVPGDRGRKKGRILTRRAVLDPSEAII
jgi:hypothetical protein